MANTIEYDDREIRAAIRRHASAGREHNPAMRDIAALLEASAQRAFEQERAPGGRSWADLSDLTKRSRTGVRARRQGRAGGSQAARLNRSGLPPLRAVGQCAAPAR